MITQAGIETLRALGHDWITARRAKQVQRLAREGSLQLSLFDETSLAEIGMLPSCAGGRDARGDSGCIVAMPAFVNAVGLLRCAERSLGLCRTGLRYALVHGVDGLGSCRGRISWTLGLDGSHPSQTFDRRHQVSTVRRELDSGR